MKTMARLAALSVVGVMAGCAPVAVSMPDLTVGFARGVGLKASQCTLVGGSPEAARLGVRTAAIQAGAVRNRIQLLQARASLGYGSGGMESWRRIASGEC